MNTLVGVWIVQVPKVITRRIDVVRSLFSVIARSGASWLDHDASTMGAALAFYTVFSIAPILIIAIGVASTVVRGDVLRADLLSQAQNLLGPTGANAVRELLTSADSLGRSRFATSIGVATLLFGASSVFVELQNSLDRIWEIPKRKRMSGLWRILRARFLSLGLVLGVGFLLMASLLVSTLMVAFGAWLASLLGHWRTMFLAIDVLLTLGISTMLFALLFKYVPQERLAWSDVWIGGAVTAVLFSIGKFSIGYYLGKGAFSSVYGIAGSFLVLLLWSYYTAQIFLFGAEFTRHYSLTVGTRVLAEQKSPSAGSEQRSGWQPRSDARVD
jgi:membrane protein